MLRNWLRSTKPVLEGVKFNPTYSYSRAQVSPSVSPLTRRRGSCESHSLLAFALI